MHRTDTSSLPSQIIFFKIFYFLFFYFSLVMYRCFICCFKRVFSALWLFDVYLYVFLFLDMLRTHYLCLVVFFE